MDQHTRSVPDLPPSLSQPAADQPAFTVVGIGVPAGGIDALLHLVEAMPADSGMAFVVVRHPSASQEVDGIGWLQGRTGMVVMEVAGKTTIAPNHIYLIPTAKDAVMKGYSLDAVDTPRTQGRHAAIDMFLRSLAEAQRERAVAVVLSEAGVDGSVGVARIKECGGVAIAEARDGDGLASAALPRNALNTGLADLVLPLAEIPRKLLELSRDAAGMALAGAAQPERETSPQGQTQAAEEALRDIMAILHLRTGHDFRHYKRASILRRLERRLQVHGLATIPDYRDFIDRHQEETSALLQDLLISVTNFFRDREAFDSLERDIMPRIFDAAATEQIRAWSVGCATGEEAYSIAMLLNDQNSLAATPRSLQVFATDIDEPAINAARRGRYGESIGSDVAPARLRQYFERDGKLYTVKKELREKVLFAMHNILRDPPFSRVHLIVCRNLLIYLSRDIQKKVFETLHYALQPGGYLFLGGSESAEAAADLFIPVDKKLRIYQAVANRGGVQRPVSMPRPDSARPPLAMTAKQPERRPPSPQELHRQMLEESMQPSVLVDRNSDLVFATKGASRYLRHVDGVPSNNILSLIHPDLKLELRTALFQATQVGANVDTKPVPIVKDGRSGMVRVLVKPAQGAHAGSGMLLLMFEETAGVEATASDAADAGGSRIAEQLDQELRHTRDHLRAMIDQYEASVEDLKASNEELQAINEELRSATEELETSKEELQSVNEELVTVNAELKSKVDETAKANDDLQNFVAATGIATIFIDRGMRIKRYTKPVAGLFNIIASDLERPLLDITHRLHYTELAEDIAQVFERLQPVEREVSSRDGNWYILRLLPYRTAEDRIDGIILTFIDISRRKAAEESVRSGEARLRLLAASTRDYAIATLDIDGAVTSWSSGAARLFGYSEREMMGNTLDILYLPEERARNAFHEELRIARETGRAEDDRWHLRKDGSRVFCSGITSCMEQDDLRGYVKIARDLTNVKRVQAQQDARLAWEKQERIRAEESGRLRDEFFAVLSHELKQPLNLIQLTAEMLSRQPEAAAVASVARGAHTIKRMVESQGKIIDDLMDLSRLHTGKLTLNRAQVSFSDAVRRVVDMMAADAQQKSVALTLAPAPEELQVQGDMVRLEQIAWNLLSNALKFTDAGGRVEASLSTEAGMACLRVSDTGKGIPAEFLPFVFDMFRQADTGTTRRYGGMGIGLALVKELVHSHGGTVEVDSDGHGMGARFTVRLPLAGAPQAAPAPRATRGRGVAGRRVLLIDDETEIVEALAQLLRLEGAEVLSATGGEAAIGLVESDDKPVHLIVSDIGMPGMDGYALLARLRALPQTASAPAIALSGFTRQRDVELALGAGFATHLSKPLAFDDFIALVNRLCG